MNTKRKALAGITALAVIGFLGFQSFNGSFNPLQLGASLIAQVDGDGITNEECSGDECGGDEIEETVTPPPPACTADTWSCGDWNACPASGNQTRTCTKTFECAEATTASPATTQKCTPPPPPCSADKWSCGNWSTCSADGVTKRTCTKTYECPSASTPAPLMSESCTPPVAEEPVATEAVKPAAEEKTPTVESEATKTEGVQESPTQTETQTTTEDTSSINSDSGAEAEKTARHMEAVAAEEQNVRETMNEEIVRSEQSKNNDRSIIETTPVFKQLVESSPPAPRNEALIDANGNGIPDGVDILAGVDTKKPDEKLVRHEAELAVKQKELIAAGTSEADAARQISEERTKFRSARKVESIREVAKKTYKVTISSHTQDSNGDGVSDETAIALGTDPREKVDAASDLSPAERVIYGLKRAKKGSRTSDNEVAMSIQPGTNLSSQGFTVLAHGKSGSLYTLYAVASDGTEIPLETKTMSENAKAVFTVSDKLKAGNYIFQIREAAKVGQSTEKVEEGLTASALKVKRLAEAPVDSTQSGAVLVNIVNETLVADPTVNNIEDIEIAGIKDIRVTRGNDGKIHVRGSTDISTTVIGTFQSAVFTAAILADVSTGSFEVVSPKHLENGDHDVVIYASRSEDSAQSKPVEVHFSIVDVTDGDGETKALDLGEKRPAAGEDEETLPLIPVAIGGGILLIVAVGFALRKKGGNV